MESPSLVTTEQPLIQPEQSVLHAAPRQVKLFKGQIILNPTINKKNFFTYMIFNLYMGIILIPINLLQAPLLTITYGLSPAASANANSIVQICQLVFQLLLAPWVGFVCDKYSRKLLIIAGVIAVTTSTVLLPNLPGIYPYYVFVLLLQCFGFLCLNIPPLLADYIDYETKGRVAGIITVISSGGSFLATLLEQVGDLRTTINDKFYEFGGITMVLGLIITFGLKGGQYHKKLRHDLKAEGAKKSLRASGVQVYDASSSQDELLENADESYTSEEREAPVISRGVIKLPESDEENTMANTINTIDRETSRNIGYIESSLNNEVSINNQIEVRSPHANRNGPAGPVGSVRASQGHEHEEKAGFMIGIREAKNPWILLGYLCGFLWFSSMNLLGFVFVTYVVSLAGDDGAASQSYALTNKQSLVGTICAIILGFGADKYDKFKQIVFYMICSAVSVIMIILMPSPYHAEAYIAMVFFGISAAGFVIFLNQLLSKYATPKYRASVNAVGTMCVITGGALVNIVGVYISQFDPRLPFFLYLGLLAIAFAMVIYVYAAKKDIIKNL